MRRKDYFNIIASNLLVMYLILFGLSSCNNLGYKDQNTWYSAPNNLEELESRLEQVKDEYTPYLRSIPEKVEPRSRLSLNGKWRFTFEIKDPPKEDMQLPLAPEWFPVNYHDSEWSETTVPEWCYRNVGYDNLYERKVDKVKISGDRRNTS